ncbi:MAG: autotransporter outer membrane beta-barrel domain-containing protein [Planctomycetota bacterium]|nr:autotransporter outer membrane beta-barrel domain-containing protein [Planctomycetota bacterium]
MRKHLAALCAIALISGSVMALDLDLDIGNSTSGYAAQTSMDAFNGSVRDRLSAVRIGDLFLTGYSSRGRYAPLASERAYGAAPSVRAATPRGAYGYEGAPRRQLECVYTSGFTAWGDVYGAWERQKAKGGGVGYKYRVGGPAIGFDWTSGGLTLGLATSYNWGTAKNVGGFDKNTRDTRTWGLMAYGQYNASRWYANATLGYGQTRFKSSVRDASSFTDRYFNEAPYSGFYTVDLGDRYRNHSWNADAEFGMKFRFGRGFLLSPSVGLQFFHTRRRGVDETGALSLETDSPTQNKFTGPVTLSSGARSYYSLQLPVGVSLAYEIAAGTALIVPQLRFAWIPELARSQGRASGDGVFIPTATFPPYPTFNYSDHAARRNRNAFRIGTGVQAKLNQYLSLHLDYDATLRARYYNHNLNLGLGVTF